MKLLAFTTILLVVLLSISAINLIQTWNDWDDDESKAGIKEKMAEHPFSVVSLFISYDVVTPQYDTPLGKTPLLDTKDLLIMIPFALLFWFIGQGIFPESAIIKVLFSVIGGIIGFVVSKIFHYWSFYYHLEKLGFSRDFGQNLLTNFDSAVAPMKGFLFGLTVVFFGLSIYHIWRWFHARHS